jgi:hypothetical protein
VADEADEAESAEFVGGVAAACHIDSRGGWRGHGRVTVGKEGIEFALDGGFRWMGHRYVKRGDLAYVYPVRARRLSLTRLVAAIAPRLSDTAVRFVTHPVGMFSDRDDYTFFSYRHEEWKLVDTLEELGYPVDRKLKTLRLYWGDEA